MKRPTFLPYAVGLLLVNATAVFAGQTTLTTYYPAPSGNYEQLRLVPRASLSGSSCLPGTLYVENTNNTLQYCGNSSVWEGMGAWTQNGNNIYPSDTANPNLKVGIGVTEPIDKLHVAGGIRSSGSAADYNNGDQLTLDYNAGTARINVRNAGSTGVLTFLTNSAERMRINSSGNVGIGVTNPLAKLDVNNGWITPQNNVVTDTNATAGLTWHTPTPTLYGIYRTAGGWNSPNYQQLKLSWDTGIVIDGGTAFGKSGTVLQPNGGNVGIGLTTPASMLHINGKMQLNQTGVTSGGRVGLHISSGPSTGQMAFSYNTSANTDVGTWATPDNTSVASSWALQFGGYNPGIFGDVDYFSIMRAPITTGAPSFSTLFRINSTGDTTVTGSVTASGFFYSSDSRLKKNIRPLTHALDKVQRLNGVAFTWKEHNVKDIGVIAQNVEKVLPELVSTGKDGMKSVKYANLVAVLIEAVKEQQKQIEGLKKEIAKLQNKQPSH